VLIQVSTCGLCGTDLHIYRGEYMADYPVIPGHEFAGTIAKVGREVNDLRAGDRVTADPNLYCGHCYFCRNEQSNHCLNWQGMGVTRPGALAEYVAVPARACYRVPDSLTEAQIALVEPLACVVYALERLRVWPGDEVLIFGAGPMGLLLLQALRHSSASQVVVVEPQPARLGLARDLGATAALSPDRDLPDSLKELAPYGFAVVVDATGIPHVIKQAFAYLKPRGRFLQFGVADREATITLHPYDVFRHDWEIIGSFAICYTFQRAIAWLSAGAVDVNPLVSHTVGLDEFPAALQRFETGDCLKIHVRP
jgi:2-desacetyl-2-hydroxyethyl bacteriochlorophyllide A dehydrogenase